jgi:hypothetical protein
MQDEGLKITSQRINVA